MKTQDFVTIIIRLMAVVLLIAAAYSIQATLIFSIQSRTFLLESFMVILTPVTLAVALWLISAKLATRITPEQLQHKTLGVAKQSILNPLIITLGLYFFIEATLKLIQWFFNAMVFKANPDIMTLTDTNQIQNTFIAMILVQILLASFVVLKSQWLTNWLSPPRSRKITSNKDDQQSD